jgi:hypothetical protein
MSNRPITDVSYTPGIKVLKHKTIAMSVWITSNPVDWTSANQSSSVSTVRALIYQFTWNKGP